MLGLACFILSLIHMFKRVLCKQKLTGIAFLDVLCCKGQASQFKDVLPGIETRRPVRSQLFAAVPPHPFLSRTDVKQVAVIVPEPVRYLGHPHVFCGIGKLLFIWRTSQLLLHCLQVPNNLANAECLDLENLFCPACRLCLRNDLDEANPSSWLSAELPVTLPDAPEVRQQTKQSEFHFRRQSLEGCRKHSLLDRLADPPSLQSANSPLLLGPAKPDWRLG